MCRCKVGTLVRSSAIKQLPVPDHSYAFVHGQSIHLDYSSDRSAASSSGCRPRRIEHQKKTPISARPNGKNTGVKDREKIKAYERECTQKRRDSNTALLGRTGVGSKRNYTIDQRKVLLK